LESAFGANSTERRQDCDAPANDADGQVVMCVLFLFSPQKSVAACGDWLPVFGKQAQLLRWLPQPRNKQDLGFNVSGRGFRLCSSEALP
jgi:hypothetical protein